MVLHIGSIGFAGFIFVGGVRMPAGVDKIVKALKEENPDWPMSKIYAIAWSTYKKKGGE